MNQNQLFNGETVENFNLAQIINTNVKFKLIRYNR